MTVGLYFSNRTGQNYMEIWALPCPITLTIITIGFEADILQNGYSFFHPTKTTKSVKAALNAQNFNRA